MKKEINATTGIAIAAVVLVALCVMLYFRFFHEQTLDPKVIGESRAGINRTMERMRKAGIVPRDGAPPNAGPAAVPGGASKPASQ